MTNTSAPSRTRSRLVTGAIVLAAVLGVVFILLPGLAMAGFWLWIVVGGGQIG